GWPAWSAASSGRAAGSTRRPRSGTRPAAWSPSPASSPAPAPPPRPATPAGERSSEPDPPSAHARTRPAGVGSPGGGGYLRRLEGARDIHSPPGEGARGYPQALPGGGCAGHPDRLVLEVLEDAGGALAAAHAHGDHAEAGA